MIEDSSEETVFVDSAEGLRDAIRYIEREPLLGVDTESNSMHCYRERVCFVQLRSGPTNFIIDTIRFRDLEPLNDVFASRDITKVLHGADYDVVCLKRDFGLRFSGLFDTMVASQFLNFEGLGLAALCERFVGVRLEKKWTRHNWALRPISREHLDYLCSDVRHLFEIHAKLRELLVEEDLLPEAECEFERVSALQWSQKDFDPERYTKIKGVFDLDAVGRTVMREIFIAREKIADELDLPPFMVMNPDIMLDFAKRRPKTFDDMVRSFRFSRRLRDSHLSMFLGAVRRVESGEIPLVQTTKERRPRRDPAEVKCEDDLKEWRKKTCAAVKRPPLAVLPNHVIAEIIERRARSVDDLREIPYFGARRCERFGEAIAAIGRRHFR